MGVPDRVRELGARAILVYYAYLQGRGTEGFGEWVSYVSAGGFAEVVKAAEESYCSWESEILRGR